MSDLSDQTRENNHSYNDQNILAFIIGDQCITSP